LILDGRDIDFASYQGFIELNDLGMRLVSVAVPDTDTHIFNLEAASTGFPIVGLAANGFDEPVSITLNVSTPRELRPGDIAVHFNVVANRAGADISPTQFFGATELGEVTYAIEEGTAEVMADPDPIFRAERSTISPADPIPSLNIINIAIGDSARLILAPNDSITLDVNVDMANVDTLDLASLQFDMDWDPEALIYQSFTPGPFGEVAANDQDTPDNGQFSANIVSSNGSKSSFTAMSLNFVAGAAGATVPRLRIESAGNEDGVDIRARMVPRTISICVDSGGLLGDVNGDQLPATTPGAEPDTTAVATAGVTDVIDTQQIARWLVDLEVQVSSRMRTHGDVNGDFKTNIVDAQQIARYSVRLPVDYFIGEEIELDCKYPLSVLTPSQKLPDALVAKDYEFQFESAGGAGDIEWHAPENWGGPEGMWIENETGILSGQPREGEEGSHTFSIRVEQDAEDWARYQEAFKSFTIDVLPQTKIVLDTLVFTEVAASNEFEQAYWIAPMGLVDSIYNLPLNAIGGGGEYTWEVLEWGRTLPDGLEIVTDSITGTSSITGTPTFTGFDLDVYLLATSKLGSSSEPTRISLTISGPLVNEIKELWPSIIGEQYAKDLWDDEYREEYGTLTAQGGDGVYTWSITAGALPDGLSMVLDTLDFYEPRSDPRNFRTRIRGIPTAAGTDTITIRLDSGDGRSVSTEYILKTQRRADKIEIQLASDTLVTTRTEWVELNMSALGDTLLLLARISDGTDFRMEDAPVTWFSADTAVVTVDSLGQVVSVGEGWVKVTATSGANADDPLADGAVRPDDYEDPLAASLYINVGVVAASVTLSDSLLTLSSFQDSIKISGVIKDSLGSVISLNNRNLWFYTDNGQVAYTDDVIGRGANPLVAGEAWVIASFENGTTTIYGATNSPEGDVVGSMQVIVQQLPVKLVMSYSLPSDPSRWLAFPSDSVMDFSSYGATSTLSVIEHEDESLRPRDARGYEIQEDGLAVTWSSSDSTVAKVDDAGIVTSVGDGSATIKVEIGSVFVTVDVTVGQRPSQVEMSGADVVSIEETSDLEAYKQVSFPGRSGTSQLVGTVKDQAGSVMSESTIVWSSSDTTIATVSSTGLVSAVGFGPATVKATVYDVDDSSKALAVGEVTAAVSFKWTSVSAGEEHSTGITTDGKIWGWGGNFSKQAGGASEGNIRTPKKFNTDLTWTSLSAGEESNAGVSSAGDAYVWGQRDGMGNGGFTDSSTPVLVSGGLVWASVSVGIRHTVGLTTDGKAYSWGQNYDGKLGSWTADIVEKSNDPVLVAGGYTWASVVAGNDHTVGLTTAGEAYAWGRNEYGGLGNGTVESTWDGDPVLVLGGHTWAQVAGGGAMSAGVTTDGDLYTWGWNRYGQLGDGTTDNRVTPVLVTGGREFSSVSVGGYYMVGITTDGDAYAWGRSLGGNLGDGEDRNRGEPVLVIGNHTWSSVTTGSYHTMGVTTDGDVYVWGNNAQGQLGDGTTQWNPTPTLLVPRIIG
jgi:alpha-tubulin suppressor-like RCC1 family protein